MSLEPARRASFIPLRRLAAVLVLACLVGAAGIFASPPAQACADWRWRRVDVPARAISPRAIAASAKGALVLGGDQGLSIAGSSGPSPRDGGWARRTPVADLVFDGGGQLWVASDDGVFSFALSGENSGAAAMLSDRSPAPGEASRRAVRIESSPRWVVVATEAGVFARDAIVGGDSRAPWRRLDGGAPNGPLAALALEAGSDRIFAAFGDELWVWEEGGASAAQRWWVAGAPAGAGILDVAVGAGELVVVYERGLAVAATAAEIRGGDAPRGGAADRRWRRLRPDWPVGLAPRRAFFVAGRWWLATDRGLLEAEDPTARFERCGSGLTAVGRAEIADVARDPDGGILVATSEGVFRGERALPTAARRAPHRARQGPASQFQIPHGTPPLAALQRAALERLGLEARQFTALERGLALRGLVPRVEFDGGWDDDRRRRREYDEAFTSGDTRRLNDRDRERSRGISLSLGLVWELDRLAFDPDAIDLSRERRLVVGLRDDLLDEMAQLYFERLRILARLAEPTSVAPEEVPLLRIRIRELEAGLDAWSGGAWTRLVEGPAEASAR